MTGGFVMTVNGPVSPDRIGFTLPHEHLYLTLGHVKERFDYPLMTQDDDILADELAFYRAAGGDCIVEATPPDIGRRPGRLRAMSERTGTAIVMGAGWYRAPYYRPEDRVEQRTVHELAGQLIAEIHDGVGDDHIRPGVIGEMGVEKAWVSPIEERTHRAAAQAQKATGLPILTHSVYDDVGLRQLDVLELEGVDPGRVAIGHADTNLDLGYLLAIVGRGAHVMFDSFMDMVGRQEERSVALVAELVARGHADRVMLSLDICRTFHLRFGGGGGFAYLSERYLPRLREVGLSEDVIRTVTVDNTRRWLTIPGEVREP